VPADFSEVIAELDALASSVSRRGGEILFRCGEPVSGIFLVRCGSVKMALDEPNPAYPPTVIGPGGIAGLPAALTGTYSLTAEVIEDAELGFIPAAMVVRLLECSPRFCILVSRTMSGEIARIRHLVRDHTRVN